MGWERVRPRQNMSIDFERLHCKQTPVDYPVQHTEHALGFRTTEPLHGVAQLQPYSEQEILAHSNHERAFALKTESGSDTRFTVLAQPDFPNDGLGPNQ
jgi:hypothetical protein